MRERVEGIARDLRSGGVRPEGGYSRVRQTRQEVERGWIAFADLMEREGQHDAAAQVRRFVDRMPLAQTDRQFIAEQILAGARERAPPTR